MQDIFTSIYKSNGWSGQESRSGTGSDLWQTKTIRRELPKLFLKYHINSLLDIPCGDYWWFHKMKHDLEKYIGADIVWQAIEENKFKYPGVDFRHLDITQDDLPQVDAVFCRDLFGHFSQEDLERGLAQVRASGSKYLIATTFTTVKKQYPDIETGKWRPINMELILGKPLDMVDEKFMGYNNKPTGKSLGIWELNRD